MNLKDYTLKRLDEARTKILEFPFENKMFYAAWLSQTHYYVQHTTRLLTMAGAYFPPGNEEFRVRFNKHAAEERGHDKIPTSDMKALGYTLLDFPEMSATSSFYEVQYYKIQHLSPTALFGWILALEGIAVVAGKELYARTKQSYGDKASVFLKVHSEEDPDHLDKAFDYVAKVTDTEQMIIRKALDQSLSIYISMLEECARKSQAENRAA